jgi:hypothetical protein
MKNFFLTAYFSNWLRVGFHQLGVLAIGDESLCLCGCQIGYGEEALKD